MKHVRTLRTIAALLTLVLLLKKYITDSAALWENRVEALPTTMIGSVVGTHAGPGAVAVAFFAGDR